MKLGMYSKFGLMMLASFIIMYGIMFLNAARFDHVQLSLMRTYMALLMVFAMAFVMLLFMLNMYKNKSLNAIIIILAVSGFAVTYYMMRNQVGVQDVQYLKAMIPHHSSAILTSEKANFQDPRTRELAEEIIRAQKEEIAQMKQLINDLENKE